MVALVGHNSDIAAPACVVLAGGLSQSPLMRETGLSPLDLWAGSAGTVGEIWRARFVRSAGPDPSVHCLCGESVPAPDCNKLGFRRHPDGGAYRGPAGALRDAQREIGAGELIVVEGARLVEANLENLLDAHRRSGAAVTVARDGYGSPAGVYIVRAEALDLVPPRGFMDLKEQWLNKLLSEGHRVEVRDLAGRSYLLKTREDFLRAARELAGVADVRGEPCGSRTLSGYGCHRSVVSESARVEPGAVVVDSVVMPGAVVRAGGVVVRSLVGPGFVVEAGVPMVERCSFVGGPVPQIG